LTNTEGNRSKARARVLCVGLGEDERILLRDYQSKAGSNVTFFFEYTPDKAVRILEETLFDCVLSGVDRGIESTELAKKVKAVTNVPYIMLEDRADAKMIRLAHAAGVNSVVPLGCESEDIAELFNIIEETVRGWREQRMTEAMVDVLQVLNRSNNKDDALFKILGILARYTRVEAVGIRLQEGNDYPYYVFDEFPDEHILRENSLCAFDLDGQLMRDEMGHPVLECMCGNVLRGRFDPSRSYFTEGGSFWTNSTTGLLSARSIGIVLDDIYKGERLEESREHYRSIFESVQDLIFIVDVDDFTVIEANKAALRWTLAGDAAPDADTCHGMLAKKKTPCELYGEACPLLRMFESRTGASNICMRFDADGNKRYIEESAYPIHDAEGEIVRAILFVRDVTERKLSEQRLLGYL
jgi:PAS domain-containing protein